MTDNRLSAGPQGLDTEESVVIGATHDDDPVVELHQESGTRKILAIIYSIGMTVGLFLVLIGGLTHAFDAALVGTVCAAYGGASGSVAFFYFRHREGGSADAGRRPRP
ncbi:hypothetical protein ACWEVP_37280 [Amycolatopsis sp. NPDC003865]